MREQINAVLFCINTPTKVEDKLNFYQNRVKLEKYSYLMKMYTTTKIAKPN